MGKKEDLQMSDNAAAEQIIEPTKKEKICLSSYCSLSLECKKAEKESNEKIKNLKPLVKDLRANLLETLRSDKIEICVISQEQRKEADKRLAAKGLPSVPPYIRISKNSKDLKIGDSVISEAIHSVTENDLAECEIENGKDALIFCIINAVRRIIRSFNEQVKLSESVPRGIKSADVPFANEKLAEEAIRLFEESETILRSEKTKRENVAVLKKEMSTKLSSMLSYFARGNITHQRVILENMPFNLCKKVSVIKPKINFALLEDLLTSEIQDADTMKDAMKILQSNRDQITKQVLVKVSTLPSKTKVSIHLQKIKSS